MHLDLIITTRRIVLFEKGNPLNSDAYPTTGPSDPRIMEAVNKCRQAGHTIKIVKL